MTAAAAFAAYNDANAAFKIAAAAYDVAVRAYRARTIGDAEYLAARKAQADALVTVDAAEAVYVEAMAAAVEETITDDIEQNGQLF